MRSFLDWYARIQLPPRNPRPRCTIAANATVHDAKSVAGSLQANVGSTACEARRSWTRLTALSSDPRRPQQLGDQNLLTALVRLVFMVLEPAGSNHTGSTKAPPSLPAIQLWGQ